MNNTNKRSLWLMHPKHVLASPVGVHCGWDQRIERSRTDKRKTDMDVSTL